MGRIGRLIGGDAGREGQDGKEGPSQQFWRADNNPAGSGQKTRNTLTERLRFSVSRKKAQEIHLLANLCHQGQYDGRRRAELRQIEGGNRTQFPRLPPVTSEAKPEIDFLPVKEGYEDEREDIEDDPDRLGQELESGDQPHTVCHERNDG